MGAEGAVFTVGSRVQTRWERSEGGDDRFYAGTITSVNPMAATAAILYDDGDDWDGPAAYMFPFHPGRQ